MSEVMPPRRRRSVSAIHIAFLLMAALTLIACGSSAAIPASEEGPRMSRERSDPGSKAAFAESDGLVDELAAMPAEAPLADGLSLDGQRAIDPGAAAATVADDALIVRTGFVELEVADLASVLLAARADIAELGGYVAGSDVYDQGEQRWASVIYRVPVERFEDAIDVLRGRADRVVRESTQSQEVTAQVVDLDARIDNLRASEDALVAIMDRAGRIDDVLAVQMRLEGVRQQIEQLTAQRDELAGRAALATITASWMTPVAAVVVAQEGWDLATEVDAALAQTVATLQGLARVTVWAAVVGLPLLGIPLLILLAAIVAIRRRGARPGGGTSGPAAVAGSASE